MNSLRHHIILLISLTLLASGATVLVGCEKIFYVAPISFPAKFTFKGLISNKDSIHLEGIRVVLYTPAEVDSIMVFTDTAGTYQFVAELEFAGPNTLKITDTKTKYRNVDTTFYINQDHWDTKKVPINFTLIEL